MTNFQKRFLSSIILFPLALYFIAHGSFMLMFLTTICFVVACYEWQMMTKKKSYKIYGFIFLIFSFYTFYELSLEIFYGFFSGFYICFLRYFSYTPIGAGILPKTSVAFFVGLFMILGEFSLFFLNLMLG